MKLICFIAAALYVAYCRHVGDGSGDASGRLRMGPGEDRSGKLPMGPPLPYLANVTDEARQQYFDIFWNFNQTIAEQKQGILTWAQKNGILAQVQEFNTNVTNQKNMVKQNVTQLIAALPAAFQQFASLSDNENQTPLSRAEALGKLSSENPQLYYVLRMIFDLVASKKDGKRHGPMKHDMMEMMEKKRFNDSPEKGHEMEDMDADVNEMNDGSNEDGLNQRRMGIQVH
ncbi:hypothetical protein Q1695_005909 [Nippostrongylus brasiliensis]|nr:hypothetical protein Q1695_005909 [Nippostrongylus brasiliensis]